MLFSLPANSESPPTRKAIGGSGTAVCQARPPGMWQFITETTKPPNCSAYIGTNAAALT
jgi:hypothetical protein